MLPDVEAMEEQATGWDYLVVQLFSNLRPAASFVDDVSADSSAEFPDRASMMEVRLQAQEDEITLLKSSLADALRRLRIHDQVLQLLKQQVIAGGWC